MKTGRVSFLGMTAAALLAVSAPARAADSATQPPEMPPALKQLEADGANVKFLGHSYGVDGWIMVNRNNERQFAYTTPEGGIILGILLAPDGTNQTNMQIENFKEIREGGQQSVAGADSPKASAGKAERVYAAVEKAGWVAVGREGAPYLYMFINTTCEHCQDFWKELQGPINAGNVQVRLVPFGKQEVNRVSGAALLSVEDPAGAWNAFIAGDRQALAPSKVKDGMLARIDANTALFRDWKMQGPPFTMYRKPGDGVITALAGKPENMMMLLADLIRKQPKPATASSGGTEKEAQP